MRGTLRNPGLTIIMLMSGLYASGFATAQLPSSIAEKDAPVNEAENVTETGRAPGNQNEKKPLLSIDLLSKTAGGTQLWTDHLYRGNYRIQQNALTGHWRLLDAKDVRKTWGTRAECEKMLDELQSVGSAGVAAEPTPRHVIVLLHGLMRTRHSMKPLEAKLVKAGLRDCIRFSYASSRSSIGDHAAALRGVLENLPPNTQFSFVGHSMGNIVVRHLIGDLQRDGDRLGILDRCRSMVMLGPPNQGAAIARKLAPSGLYGILTGKGGMELGPEWQSFVEHLATPPFPFCIIAGDVSSSPIQNPLVDGSGDFVVGLEEAKLKGAESFETVPVLHSFLMNDETAINRTIAFIQAH